MPPVLCLSFGFLFLILLVLVNNDSKRDEPKEQYDDGPSSSCTGYNWQGRDCCCCSVLVDREGVREGGREGAREGKSVRKE